MAISQNFVAVQYLIVLVNLAFQCKFLTTRKLYISVCILTSPSREDGSWCVTALSIHLFALINFIVHSTSVITY